VVAEPSVVKQHKKPTEIWHVVVLPWAIVHLSFQMCKMPSKLAMVCPCSSFSNYFSAPMKEEKNPAGNESRQVTGWTASHHFQKNP
jgi:hypothetical protein